jgi:hypothetical protein
MLLRFICQKQKVTPTMTDKTYTPLITHVTSKYSKLDESSIEFTLEPPAQCDAPHFIVKQLQVLYQTVDDKGEKDFLARLKCVQIMQDNLVLHCFTPTIWGVMLFFQKQQLLKNRKTSTIYIPLWCEGLQDDITKHPVVIRFEFAKFQQEEKRLSILAQLETKPKYPEKFYWTSSGDAFVKVPVFGDDEKTLTMRVQIPTTPPPLVLRDQEIGSKLPLLSQVVFQIDGAANWIQSAKLWFVKDGTSESNLLAQFENAYDGVTVDKTLNSLGFPSKPYFSFTFDYWLNRSFSRETNCVKLRGDGDIILELNLDPDMPKDSRPKDAILQIFSFMGLPLRKSRTYTQQNDC